ncbi:MAG: AAA family ATPase [Granulosicoccus sp.]
MHQLLPALNQQIVGLHVLTERLLIALLCGGHILIEGPPGVAKTRTIKQFARLIDASFVRIQATPDLLPADMTGSDIFHQPSGEFRFMPGPLFNHIVLVDEINRAPPKVQSALLEAMGEHQVSTGGTTRLLDEPFLVAATQNPIEHEGTYPLPEAQLDRFMFFVQLSLPDIDSERLILDQVIAENSPAMQTVKQVSAIGSAQDVMDARQAIQSIFISDAVRDYIVRLTGATRGEGMGAVSDDEIEHAASPRASINLALAARAYAWLQHRDHVTPDDVARLAPDILCGRIILDYRARAAGVSERDIVLRILENTPRV